MRPTKRNDSLAAAYVRERLDYDADTGELIWRARPEINGRRARWNRDNAGKPAGVRQNRGYVAVTIDGWPYLAHRLVWLHQTGVWPENQIDHVNGDRKDNRLSNLRAATSADNNRNKGVPASSRSGIKGVQRRSPNSWQATITVNTKRIALGSYQSAEEAKIAYDRAALLYFGEFAHA